MIIKLSPVRSDAQLTVSRLVDMLTINNVAMDFSKLPDGATLPASAVGSPHVLGAIERVDGKLIVTLRLPHSADAPHHARFPADIVDPADGAIQLPGLEIGEQQPSAAGAIDWSQVVTAEQKATAQLEQLRTDAVAEAARNRAIADMAIGPLQDAVDLEEATEAEAAELKAWKKYRIALIRVPDQPGYPDTIDWPAPPA